EEDLADLRVREDPDVVLPANDIFLGIEPVPVREAPIDHVRHGEVREHEEQRDGDDEEEPRRDPPATPGARRDVRRTRQGWCRGGHAGRSSPTDDAWVWDGWRGASLARPRAGQVSRRSRPGPWPSAR